MGKIAFVFSIIGCCRVGMGRDLYQTFPEFKAIFDQISDLSGIDIARLCFEGPEERLVTFNKGTFAQLAMSLGCFRLVTAHGIKPDFLCGMCEGQVMSWAAAEALDIRSAIEVCQKVAALMDEAPMGLMARIIGLEVDLVESICRQANQRGVVDIAIVMDPKAVSIAGEPHAVKMALELAREAGAEEMRPVPIEPRPVHSRLLKPTVQTLPSALSHLHFQDPQVPIISSLDGQPKYRAEELLPTLVRELYSTSDWYGALRWLIEHSVDTFLSLGVARGDLVRAVEGQITSLYAHSLETLNATLAHLKV